MLHNSTAEGVTLNELADAADTTATESHGSNPLRVQADKLKLKEAFRISRRIATIEAHIRKEYPSEVHYDPDHSKL